MAHDTILIVEDEDNFAHALDIVLSREGYATRRVAGGNAALEALAQSPADLILLDVCLPDRSGFEICKAIRQTDALHHARIVLMSARGGQAERRKGLALGADAFLDKPFATSDLIREIARLTERTRDG